MITSLFTYWAKYVKESVQHYKKLFSDATVIVGGIYASLMPKHCKEYTGCDKVFIGVHKKAEKFKPAYNLINNPHPVGYQIIHTSRGCVRRCKFCGVYKVEPKFTYKKSIKNEIYTDKIVFYDNNLLANPHIKDILEEIASMNSNNGKIIRCEAQSGFDGRLLTPELAKLIGKAKFENPRIAWDGPYSQWREIRDQVNMLVEAGYRSKEIFIFMLYNWEISFKEMEKKRLKCWGWKIQIADCRFRPLNWTYDNYDPKKKQTNEDYFIHPKWTDVQVKQFRKNVRRQNICVRFGFPFYSKDLERKCVNKEIAKQLRVNGAKSKFNKSLNDMWVPDPSKFSYSQ